MGIELGGNGGRTGRERRSDLQERGSDLRGTGSDWGGNGVGLGRERGRTDGERGSDCGEWGADWTGTGVGLAGRNGGLDWSIRGGGQLIWPHSLPQMHPDRLPLREARECRVHGARRAL